MKEIVSILSSKGQVTIPAEIRKYLNIKEGDKISFLIEDEGSVRVVVPRYRSVAALRGAAGSLRSPKEWQEVIQIAREDHTEEISSIE